MKKLAAILIWAVALTLTVGGAAPALAATYTETVSFVNSWGNTVIIDSTYVDGVLVSRTSREVLPDGTVKIEKSWTFYSSGGVETYEEFRYSTVSPTHIQRTFSESGVLLFQDAELYMGTQLTVESLTYYDASGNLLKQEDRVLTTLADGTQVWNVTVSLYENNTLVSQTVTQYPSGYNFDAPPAGEEPPADDPPADDPLPMRPGWGYGDPNHRHSGPAGKGAEVSGDHGPQAERFQDGSSTASSTGSSSGSGSSNASSDVRPGEGHGDRNHDHTGAGGKNK